MSALRFRRLTSEDDRELTEFLDFVSSREPCVLGYHYPFYREMLVQIGAGEPLYLGAWRDGKLEGVLPGFFRRAAAGFAYCSLPFFGPNAGVLYRDEPIAAETQAALLEHAVQHLRSCFSDLLSATFYSPFLVDEPEVYRRALPNALEVERKTQYLDLKRIAWNKSIRYDLRKAEALGVVVSEEIDAIRLEASLRDLPAELSGERHSTEAVPSDYLSC